MVALKFKVSGCSRSEFGVDPVRSRYFQDPCEVRANFFTTLTFYVIVTLFGSRGTRAEMGKMPDSSHLSSSLAVPVLGL